MKTAQELTDSLERKSIDINLLRPNPLNPNKMDDQNFNFLYDNLQSVGLTDPILVRQNPLEPGTYRIVGGHHRWEAAKLHGLETVPVTVITTPDFDEDMERFQLVRHNVIKGKMDPQKFFELYQSLEGQYSEEIARELFGFADEAEFQKLIKSTAKSLPKEMRKDFMDAAAEVRTIEELADILNKMFAAHGDTLPYGYMVFDFGGKEHAWVRMQAKDRQDFIKVADFAASKSKSFDRVLITALQLIAKGNFDQDMFMQLIAKLPDIDVSKRDEGSMSTDEYLQLIANVDL